MAAAKYHILGGFVSYIGFVVAYYGYFISRFSADMLVLLADVRWLTLGLFLALFGSTLPDYDLLYKSLSPWHHRSAITHSILIPVIVILFYLSPAPINNYALFLVPFMVGFMSHLFLDLFPNTDIENLMKKEKFWESSEMILIAAETGLTPEMDLKKEMRHKLSGTYNIQFPQEILIGKKKRRTLTPDLTRIWLVINGSIILIIAVALFLLFAPLL